MKKTILIVMATLAQAGVALAHPAVVDHGHPHGASLLLGLDTLAAAAGVLAVAAGGIMVARRRAKRAGARK